APGARADFIDLYANKLDVPQNKAPRVGRSRLVLIPVQIDGYEPVDVEKLKSFFQDPAGNFHSYFAVASNHRFQPEVVVAPLVQYASCPSMLDQNNCAIPRGDAQALGRGVEFLRDVFRRSHDENHV